MRVAGGNDVTDAEALRRAQQMREHGLIMDPRHPLARTGFGRSTYEDPTGATQALGEAYLRAYGELAAGAAAGPLARGAPVVAERLAIRGLNFAFDPRGGSFKGTATGFGFGLSGLDSAGVEIPGNPAFQRGFAFGEGVGNLVGTVFQLR